MSHRHPQPGDFDVLPCGCTIECVLEEGRPTVKYAPCHTDCEFYLYTINRAASQDKPVVYRES